MVAFPAEGLKSQASTNAVAAGGDSVQQSLTRMPASQHPEHIDSPVMGGVRPLPPSPRPANQSSLALLLGLLPVLASAW